MELELTDGATIVLSILGLFVAVMLTIAFWAVIDPTESEPEEYHTEGFEDDTN